MPTRRVMNKVLTNFLSSFTSRRTNFDGYWAFGFITDHLKALELDLLDGNVPDGPAPLQYVLERAVDIFQDQASKAGLTAFMVKSATLSIHLIDQPPTTQVIEGHERSGELYQCTATAEMDNGSRFQQEVGLFIAPHDPDLEMRRTEEGS